MFCSELEPIEREIRLLQSELERSRRTAKPQDYKYDGTTKPGPKK